MSLATGCLMFVGFIFLMAGMMSKFIGIPILAPLVYSNMSCFIAANTCLLLALIVDKFEKR